MVIYITIFVLSSIFFYLSKHEDKRMSIIYTLLGCFVLVFFAGVRDKTIGTDTTFYAEEVFQDAVNSHSLPDYIEMTTRAESGYAVVNYIVSVFTDNLNWLLFVIQVLTILFLLLAVYELKMEQYILCIMLVYMFLFYNHSLNFIRQMLAMTVFLYAYACYESAKYKRVVLLLLLGFFFHKSIIFGVMLFAFTEIFVRATPKIKIILSGFFILIVLSFLANLETIIMSFATVDMLENYQHYTGDEMGEGSNNTEIALRLFFIAIIIYIRNCKYITKDKAERYLMYLSIEIFFFLISMLSMYLYRVGMFIGILEIFYVPLVLSKITPKFDRIVLSTIIYSLMFFQWYWLWVNHGIGETVPYTSTIFGIEA